MANARATVVACHHCGKFFILTGKPVKANNGLRIVACHYCRKTFALIGKPIKVK
jgi:uncharacterized Zn-finger protein